MPGLALTDVYSNVAISARWLHVLLGISWIGQLYYFDFVTAPMRRSLDYGLMRTALAWLRWTSFGAMVSGVLLLALTYLYSPDQGIGPTKMLVDGQGITDRAVWVLWGMVLATVMWFEIWFVVVPAEMRILVGDAKSEEIQGLSRRSQRALRIATLLSGPMIFGMLAPAHYGAVNWSTLGIVLLVGMVAAAAVAKVFGLAAKGSARSGNNTGG